MRDILFRGKRTDDGEWIEGIYCPYKLNIFLERENKPQIIIISEDKKIDGLWCEVIPETIGQYTGLTDKNGVRIFEGDIVECWSEGVKARGTVQQRIDGLWIIYPAWQKHIMWGLCPDNDGNTTVEVIGNIHDNPELFKSPSL